MKKLIAVVVVSILSSASFGYTLSQSCGAGKGTVVVKLKDGFDPVASLNGQEQYLSDIYDSACAHGGGTFTYDPAASSIPVFEEPVRIRLQRNDSIRSFDSN